MNTVSRDIFRAIHEGKWLSIEYRNRSGRTTRYWIGIRDLDVKNRSLAVEGLHLGQYTVGSFDRIFIDSILSSAVLEGSYCAVNQDLVRDIYEHPEAYSSVFENSANLKILTYLEMCSRMDTTPYICDYSLVRYLDRERLTGDEFPLSDEQFRAIVKDFQYRTEEKRTDGTLHMQHLAMNVLSVHTPQGLYVLAYRRLELDVKARSLRPAEDITICSEFTVDGSVQSVRRFLDAEDTGLLREFERNAETIKDRIAERLSGRRDTVDDLPYILGLGMDVALDLHSEYQAVIERIGKGGATVPLRAFFGDLLRRPRGRKPCPIDVVSRKINRDQLLAIYNAMRYPLTYVQGPPGTGKTNTIINTIVTAFCNGRTVLFTSYNNHPINSVCTALSGLEYRGRRIPFPMLRLGNYDKVREAVLTIRMMRAEAGGAGPAEEAAEQSRTRREQMARRLSEALSRYEEYLDLKERRETTLQLLHYEKEHGTSMQMLSFEADLGGRQLARIERKMESVGEVTEEETGELLEGGTEELMAWLYESSVRHIRRLEEPAFAELRNILDMEEGREQTDAFARYLRDGKNVRALQKVFPVMATTCISAHRLGDPEPLFDMTIMDEASQCSTAVSLVPVIRGKNLMLVGDPQQLNPVILLDEAANEKLKCRYGVPDEYDYCKNSIYKVFLACDAVSDEILLHSHYRCHRDIIGFNNRKYYNSKLTVCSDSREKQPLVYIDTGSAPAAGKNTSPAEARAIVDYALENRDRSLAVITPFVNQRKLIEDELRKAGLSGVTCGTVHAFQGDEKDVVLFSTAVTDQTREGTYNWLKSNRELINVATSRAVNRLVVLSSRKNLERLHGGEEDDLYELARYVWTSGTSRVTPVLTQSRALGVKPYSTATEAAFLENLTHALENIWLTQSRYVIHREVAISHVFWDSEPCSDLFYKGSFDFVVYEKRDEKEIPILAIELDGREHVDRESVRVRDRKKAAICREHGLQLIRVENSYARRYNYIRDILDSYFRIMH